MSKPEPKIRDLYPYLTEDELNEAEYRIECYLKLVMQIYDRLEAEGKLSLIEGGKKR